jgi:hypothetical protein
MEKKEIVTQAEAMREKLIAWKNSGRLSAKEYREADTSVNNMAISLTMIKMQNSEMHAEVFLPKELEKADAILQRLESKQ